MKLYEKYMTLFDMNENYKIHIMRQLKAIYNRLNP